MVQAAGAEAHGGYLVLLSLLALCPSPALVHPVIPGLRRRRSLAYTLSDDAGCMLA